MARPVRFKPPQSTFGGLAVSSFLSSAETADWSDEYDSESGEPRYNVVMPTPTLGVIADYAADLLTPAQAKRAERKPSAPAPADLAEEFEQSEGFDEWRNANSPMMNFVYYVVLPYNIGEKEVADRIEAWGLAVCLVAFEEETDDDYKYAFALTGGGMYLGDHIAAAYVAAGCLPPLWLLRDVTRALPSDILARLPMARIMREARATLRHYGDDLKRNAATLKKYADKA